MTITTNCDRGHIAARGHLLRFKLLIEFSFGSAQKFVGGRIMHLNQDYSVHILTKVEDLASRVHLLKDRMAKQTVSVKLEHYWELSHIRRSFAEFKWRLEEFDEDDDSRWNRDYEGIEATWKELVHAVDALLVALP